MAPGSTFEVRLAGYVADTQPSWRTRTHSNPNFELVVATGNRIHFQRGTRPIELSGGHFLLLRPNEVHTGWGDPDPHSGFYYAQFQVHPPPWEVPVLLGSVSVQHEPLLIPLWGRLPQPGDVVSQFVQVVDEWRHRPPHYRVRLQALLAEMLVDMGGRPSSCLV
jgi:hypothetical protein